MASHRARRTGLVLGKFLPPHAGHRYLVDFARAYVTDLTVLVCTLSRDPIPGALRHKWMREMFPDCAVVHVDDDALPQAPDEHPDFWPIWRDVVRAATPEGPECVFASEPYGEHLAHVLGAEFVPVDLGRRHVPVSGTQVRTDPMRHWDFIPEPVRPWFVRRVCFFGPESTGKSTLAAELARHFDTLCVEEYARPLLDSKRGRCDPDDIPRIARGQIASEEALARQANRLLFCDTDPLTTLVWSEHLFGTAPDWLREEAAHRRYDLTLLLDTDAPWIDDGTRIFADPRARHAFFERCVAALEARDRPYVRLSGPWEVRLAEAVAAVEALLARPETR